MTLTPTDPSPTVGRPGRRLLIATVVVLCLLSAVLGVVGSFLSLSMPHVLGVPVPVGILIAVVGNLALGMLGARGADNRLVPIWTALVWLVVALLFSMQGPGGDGILTTNGRSTAFLLLGTMAAALAIGLVPGRAARRALRSSPEAVLRR